MVMCCNMLRNRTTSVLITFFGGIVSTLCESFKYSSTQSKKFALQISHAKNKKNLFELRLSTNAVEKIWWCSLRFNNNIIFMNLHTPGLWSCYSSTFVIELCSFRNRVSKSGKFKIFFGGDWLGERFLLSWCIFLVEFNGSMQNVLEWWHVVVHFFFFFCLTHLGVGIES